MLSVIYFVMLSIILLHVVMPSVVAPKKSKDIIEDYQLNIFIDLVRYAVSFGVKMWPAHCSTVVEHLPQHRVVEGSCREY